MQAHSSSKNVNVKSTSKDATTTTKKKKLLQQIHDLRCIIKQCEWNLEISRFKEVEEHTTKFQSSRSPSRFSRIPNVKVDLQSDLYRFAGFHCDKFRREEIIFNFTSTNEQQKDNTYALQIFIKDGKASLGKWVMPMSVDMNYMLTQTPIDKLKNLTTFIKSCKHVINCYVVRKEQFFSLKKHILHMKHCSLQSNIGYTQISLELYGVHDSENDRYMNLIIYLLYHSDKARPYKIEYDTMNESKLSNDIRQKLKVYFKEFKISDLQTAFDKVLAEENSTIRWILSDDSESPLELNNTSSSGEEGFLIQLQSDKKKSLRNIKRKRELQKKWNERKRQKISRNVTSSEDSEEISQSAAKVSHMEKSLQIPIRKKKKIPFISKQQKSKNLPEETTPLHKPKVKLKQTKLNFQNNQVTNTVDANKIPSVESKLHNLSKKKLKMGKMVTSTPLYRNVRSINKIPVSPNFEIDNITDIEISKQAADKSNNISSSSHVENKITPGKKTTKLLRNSVKSTELASHSEVAKTNQRLTRSMTYMM